MPGSELVAYFDAVDARDVSCLSHACARLLRQPFLAPSAKHGKRRSPRREPSTFASEHGSVEFAAQSLKVDLSGTGDEH